MQVRRETASHQFAQKKPANTVFRHLCTSRVFRFLSKGDNHQENALCHAITLQSPAPRFATVPKVIWRGKEDEQIQRQSHINVLLSYKSAIKNKSLANTDIACQVTLSHASQPRNTKISNYEGLVLEGPVLISYHCIHRIRCSKILPCNSSGDYTLPLSTRCSQWDWQQVLL